MLLKIAERLQDTAQVLSDQQRVGALAEALQDYQKWRPRVLVADIAGANGYDYALPLDWVGGESVLQRIEYPAGSWPPLYLEDEDWTIYHTADGTLLRMLLYRPGPTQTLRLTYTAPYTYETLPAADVNAIANKAASIACRWLAAHYAQEGQSSISADVTNQESKARQYRDLAKDYAEAYETHLGLSDDTEVAAASAVLDWDMRYVWGSDRLTHPRKWL
jgi:hypothetical protein